MHTAQQSTINPVFAGYAARQLQEATGGIDRVFDNLLEIARGNDPYANGYDRLRTTRVLYDRGFGKVTRNTPRTPTQGSERPPKSEESNNHTNHSSDNNRPVARLEQKLDDALGPPQSPDKQQGGATLPTRVDEPRYTPDTPDSSRPTLASPSPPTTPSDTSAAGSPFPSTPASTNRTSTAPSSTAPTRTGASSTVSTPSAPSASTSPSGRSSESRRKSATAAECFRASNWSPKMPKRPKMGQMRQVRQMRGRFKIAKLPQPQSWTASRSALSAALAAGAAGFSKTFPRQNVADSPKLIQTNSIPGIP